MINKQIEFFRKKGYCIVNLFTKNEINELKNKVSNRLAQLAKGKRKSLAIDRDLGNYHKIDISDEVHALLVNSASRYISINEKIINKIISTESVINILQDNWGHTNFTINWVGASQYNQVEENKVGFRLARPYTIAPRDVGGEHLDIFYSTLTKDRGIVSSGKNYFLTLWTPLIGFSEKYTLRLAPGSHLISHPMSAIIKQNEYISPVLSKQYLRKFKFIRPRLKKGQAILFHPFLIHGASINHGQKTRVSVEFRLFNSESDNWN